MKHHLLIKLLPFFIMTSLTGLQCSRQPNLVSTAQPTGPHYGLIYYSERDSSSVFQENNFGGLYLVDLLTKEETYLTEGSNISITEGFSWSPVTKQLIYTERGNEGVDENEFELYLLDLMGEKIQLTDNDVNDNRGQWSPDGQIISFWSSRPENSWFYLMDPDGSNVRSVFSSDYNSLPGFSSAWSPDSKKLAVSAIHAYTDTLDLNNPPDDLQLVELQPQKILPPLEPNRVRTEFSWSKDSNKLVYLSDPVALNSFERVYTSLYVLDIETQEEKLIAKFPVIGAPHWSPVEDIIAFSAATPEEIAEETLNLYVINGDGTDLRRLTDGGFYQVASWSPDGHMLALEFIGKQLNEQEIYIFDLKDRTLNQITDNKVIDMLPIWIELN